MHYKDAILNQLADKANVAQFVSFDPDLIQRYARIFGHKANYTFTSIHDALEASLKHSSESSVNIRCFNPNSPKTQEFIYGLSNIDEIECNVRRLASYGLHTIVNETIDVCDGGVSGVLLDDVIEFAPLDTPRCVEKPGTAALPRHHGLRLLQTVYGFSPALDYPSNIRVEFSIHPQKRGFLQEHTIIWELEDVEQGSSKAQIHWPNRFSHFIGDKVYGLLIADLLKLPVPETTVISRQVAPFCFGQPTGSAEVWIRTCPNIQTPGKFSTYRGWHDPFQIMASEDPKGDSIASIIAQKGVEAIYSGALVVSEKLDDIGQEEIIVEGTQGFGDDFMVGRKKRSNIPDEIVNSVKACYKQVASRLGPIRMEWVADSERIWIVQLHSGATKSSGCVIYPGKAHLYHQFFVERGLEELRDLISSVEGKSEGIALVGDVGITSHLGDVLRRAKIPSIIALTTEEIDKILPGNESVLTKVAEVEAEK